MADVFREVDEDLRREQLKKLWDRLGPYVLGLAVLIVVAVSGYKLWEYWQRHQAETTGDQFIAAIKLSEDGKHDETIAALQGIVASGSGSYPSLAGFRLAGEKADAGDAAGAIAEYDAIAGRAGLPEEMRSLARLRAALLLVDQAPFAEIKTRIGDLASIGNPWRHSAREILGLSAWRSGDYAEAKTYFEQISTDQDSPAAMRQRSTLMLTLIGARTAAAEPAKQPSG
jgi:hypothetical protein